MQLFLEPILYSNKAVVVTAYQKFIILRTYVQFSSLPQYRFNFKFIQKDNCDSILMFESLKSPWPQPEREFINIKISVEKLVIDSCTRYYKPILLHNQKKAKGAQQHLRFAISQEFTQEYDMNTFLVRVSSKIRPPRPQKKLHNQKNVAV
jgi:hypothetical protein